MRTCSIAAETHGCRLPTYLLRAAWQGEGPGHQVAIDRTRAAQGAGLVRDAPHGQAARHQACA